VGHFKLSSTQANSPTGLCWIKYQQH